MNTDGINSTNDITLSGDSNAYFDNLSCGTFQDVSGAYFTGITSNVQTQINGISSSLSGYGQLAIANTWTENNTFSKGILPRTVLTNTNIQISANAMANRQATSLNNIGIGLNSLVGDSNPAGYVYSTGSKNIGIGNSALQQQGSGNSCIAIGHEAMQLTGLERIYGGGVSPSRCIAIGEGSQKVNLVGVDNITIGYNTMPSNVSGQGNILIGSNVGGGLSDFNGCLVIGSGALPSAGSNALIVMGYEAMGASTGVGILACIAIGERALYNCSTSGCLGIGYQALYNLTTGFDNQAIGYLAGGGCVTGLYNQFIGRATNTTKSDVVNSVCLGYNAQTKEDYEFVIGGNAGGYPRLTIPEKTRLACNQEYTSGTTINLTFRSNENIILTAATLTTLNLPSITGSVNIGAKFNIYRSIGTTNSLLLTAAAGQSIDYVSNTGAYTTIPNPGTFPIYFNDPKAEIICVSTTKWLIISRVISVASAAVNISTNLTPAVTLYSVPFGVSGGASNTTFTTLSNDTGLTFDTSTTTLTSTNMYATTTSTGDMTVRATLKVNLNFQPYETSELLSSATVLPSLPTLFGVYYFASGGSATTITLPLITVDIIGCPLIFRRITNTTSALIIKTPSGSGQTIVQRASITETASFTNYTFLATTVFSGTLCAITTTKWAVLA